MKYEIHQYEYLRVRVYLQNRYDLIFELSNENFNDEILLDLKHSWCFEISNIYKEIISDLI